MWTKQQQRHDFDNYVDWRASKTRTSFEYDDSWEEQAFAEDASGPLGGCIWPPRSYSCSFCRREFRSAQALGGHMNVHRRDRARLKQTPNPQNNPFTSLSFQSPSQAQQVCTLVYDVPNPKTYHTSSAMTDVMSCNRSKSDPNFQDDEKTRVFDPTIKNKDYVETGFSNKGLSIDFGQSRPTSSTTVSDDQEKGGRRSKRRKTDDGKSIQFCFKSSSLVERHHHHHIQSEVIGLSSTSLHELDLELRLGAL